MRIDGIFSTTPGGAQQAGGNPAGKASQPGQAGSDLAIVVDSEIRHRHQKYLPQAAAVGQVNQQAVEEARLLLREGRLDSPDAHRRAAEAIANLGA